MTNPPGINPFTIVDWLLAPVKIVLAPYMKIIQFIKDFFKYIPPLAAQANYLVSNASRVPLVTTGIITKITKLK